MLRTDRPMPAYFARARVWSSTGRVVVARNTGDASRISAARTRPSTFWLDARRMSYPGASAATTVEAYSTMPAATRKAIAGEKPELKQLEEQRGLRIFHF